MRDDEGVRNPLADSPDPRPPDGTPPGYVALVERNLGPLRVAAARVVGGEADADRLYPDALADVAVCWGCLDLLRRAGFDLADRLLWRAFDRRAARWRAAPAGGGDGVTAPADLRVWGPGGPPPLVRPDTPDGAAGEGAAEPDPEPVTVPAPAPAPAPAPRPTSMAMRLAPLLRPPVRPEDTALLEATIAWCHASEWWRKARRIGTAVAIVLVFLLLVRLSRAAMP